MKDAILGIQIGTDLIRVKSFSPIGHLIGSAEERIKIYHPEAHYHELDADELWAGTCRALRQCIQRSGDIRVLSVGVSSVGESHVMLDRWGKPLGRVIAWYDQRAVHQADALTQCIGEREIYTLTGQFISPKFGICKAMWIRDNTPEVFPKIRHLLTLHDYIIHKLTDQAVTEYSLASRMMCFDIQKLSWSETLLEFARLPASALPRVLAGGSLAGMVTPKAARLSDLAAGTPVFVGGHDHACAAVTVNIFDDDVMLDSMGAAETTMVATASRVDIEQGFQHQVAIYPHFGSKLYRAVTSIQAFGTVLEWLQRLAAPGRNHGGPDVGQILSLACGLAECHSRLIFLPHLRGMQEAAGVRGMFFGLDETCDYPVIARAVAEGLCYELRRRTEAYTKTIGDQIFSIRAVGDYSTFVPLMYLKANITAKRIETIHNTDAVTFGAAIIGALGANIFSESDLQNVFQPDTAYVPEYKTIQGYEGRYAKYTALNDCLEAVHAAVEGRKQPY